MQFLHRTRTVYGLPSSGGADQGFDLMFVLVSKSHRKSIELWE